ncbi:3-methyl-2-oxobutanoate hydroxymethyltransferase [hydrothermal vent metagenome]|uniref:3-methyl-2-oxobutanoate hydroxymethyltransferase n=1 Tax=hydrothermal vent metagenome TaxID=652676 RepID=A0A3B0ZEM8_9ZZZZ
MITTTKLQSMKTAGEKIACLTAYDASFASLLNGAGVDVVLVGDSLGMVVQGYDSTVPVTVDDIVYHSKAVAKGCRDALLMVDMPFLSYATTAQAVQTAARLMQEGGAHMVKLEGSASQEKIIRVLADNGIASCAHLGLRPQFVHKLGGYRVQGRDDEGAAQLLADVILLQDAGADAILLECVPAELAAKVTASVTVPVIGIGAGKQCDGQVLVLYDLLGITPGKIPRFAKNFMPESNSIKEAVCAYVKAVKEERFPAAEHTFN